MKAIDQLFSLHRQSVQLRSRRAELLAANLANADTPNYKAQDINFEKIMRQTHGTSAHGGGTQSAVPVSTIKMVTTQARHIHPGMLGSNSFDVQYRIPQQSSLDGNTVNTDIEKSEFTENAMRYQISLTFLSKKISGMIRTLKGE